MLRLMSYFAKLLPWMFAVVANWGVLAFAMTETPKMRGESVRLLYQSHDYRGAILALNKALLQSDEKWIMAESLFRIGKFEQARGYFEELLEQSQEQLEQSKALLRIIECDLRTKKINKGVEGLENYKTRFKESPARLTYALAKALFDAHSEDKARILLKRVPSQSEFGIRARYIEAAISLGKASSRASIKSFDDITKMSPQSVEDYSVIEMAKLAVARIYADMGQIDLALKAYERVKLDNQYGDVATVEIVRVMMAHAELAVRKEGRFKDISDLAAEYERQKGMASAHAAFQRYNKVKNNKIDWRKPELLTVKAWVLGKDKRYDEADVVYEELRSYYRGLQDQLQRDRAKNDTIWPYFKTGLSDDKKSRPAFSIIEGMPNFLLRNISGVKEIASLRDQIDESARTLASLEQKAKAFSLKMNEQDLLQARRNHQEVQSEYEKIVLQKQAEVMTSAIRIINEVLVESEFKRVQLALEKRQDLRNQLDFIRDFQTKSTEAFEKELSKVTKGGAL